MFYGLNEAELGAFKFSSSRRIVPKTGGVSARAALSASFKSNQMSGMRRVGNVSSARPVRGSVVRGSFKRGVTFGYGLGEYEVGLGKFKMKKIVKSVTKATKQVAKVAVKPMALVAGSSLQAVGLRKAAGKLGKNLGLSEAERKLTKYGGTAIQAAALTAGAIVAAPYVGTALATAGKGAMIAGKFAATKLMAAKTLLPKGIALAKNLIGKKQAASEGGEEAAPAYAEPSSAYEAPAYTPSYGGETAPASSGGYTPSYGGGSSGGSSESSGGMVLPEQEAGAEQAPAASGGPSSGGITKLLIPAAAALLLL